MECNACHKTGHKKVLKAFKNPKKKDKVAPVKDIGEDTDSDTTVGRVNEIKADTVRQLAMDPSLLAPFL